MITGPGDVTPATDTGNVIDVVVTLIGFVAVLTGAIAERFTAPRAHELEADDRELITRLDAIAARPERVETTG